MEWESLGFRGNPLNTDPIRQSTLELYVGHKDIVAACQNVLASRNVNLIIEGARGVGTTSFANSLRFHSQKRNHYFTPSNEIRVEKGWTLDTLLAVIISNVIREIELFHSGGILNDKRFQDAKSISTRIAEAYRSFGVGAFGINMSYGKSAGISSQPVLVPSPILGHHLEDLSNLIQKLGFKYGILVQLNNLDIGTIHDESQIRDLFNALRDYMQMDGVSWLLVGDIGLRRFIAQEVDRVDDIINYEIEIKPLDEIHYLHLLQKRLEFYRNNVNAEMPVDQDVFIYLYRVAKGRLRYIFSLLDRLVNTLHIGDLTDKITLSIAKPTIIKLAKDRIGRNKLNPSEELILHHIVKHKEIAANILAKQLNKSTSFISKILSRLLKLKLVTFKAHGRSRIYSPVLDAEIAFSDEG